MTPTQLSLKRARTDGGFAQVVEHWNPFAKVRQDLFKWIDIVAVHPKLAGVIGIQTTTASNVSARAQKARHNPALKAWINAGGRLLLHGWEKKKNRWVLSVDRELCLEDLE
jgi:hypothetical protein